MDDRLLDARELDEIVQLFEDVGRRLTTRPADRVAQLDRAVERRASAVEQRVNRHDIVRERHRFGEALAGERLERGYRRVEG